jgi:hypothetical protein
MMPSCWNFAGDWGFFLADWWVENSKKKEGTDVLFLESSQEPVQKLGVWTDLILCVLFVSGVELFGSTKPRGGV